MNKAAEGCGAQDARELLVFGIKASLPPLQHLVPWSPSQKGSGHLPMDNSWPASQLNSMLDGNTHLKELSPELSYDPELK